MKKFLFLSLLIPFLLACQSPSQDDSASLYTDCPQEVSSSPIRVSFQTEDELTIVGNFYNAGTEKIALFLHGSNYTKESMTSIAEKFYKEEYSSLAIDLRGRGESDDKKTRDVLNDPVAAISYLEDCGFEQRNIVLLGTSLGAALTTATLPNYPDIKLGFALSVGLGNNFGTNLIESVKSLAGDQTLILVASDDDPLGNYEDVQILHEANPNQTVLILKSGLGHAIEMVQKNPALLDELTPFLP